jgi:hypothetical protein
VRLMQNTRTLVAAMIALAAVGLTAHAVHPTKQRRPPPPRAGVWLGERPTSGRAAATRSHRGAGGSLPRRHLCRFVRHVSAQGRRGRVHHDNALPLLFWHRCAGVQPFFKRLPVLHASRDELRPRRDGGKRVGLLRQQTPQRRVVPTEILAAGIAVLPDPRTQFLNFADQLLFRHLP